MNEADKKKFEDDIQFLSIELKYLLIKYDISLDGKSGLIIANNNGVEKTYEPETFCDLLIEAYCGLASNDKDRDGNSDLGLQAVRFSLLNGFITVVLSRFVNYVEDKRKSFPDLRKYDFSGTLKMAESYVDQSRFNLEAKLIINQFETNKSVRETNKDIRETNENIRKTNENTNRSNEALKSIFWKTLIVAILGLAISAANTFLSFRKDTLSQELQESQSHLIKDSLEILKLNNALDSAHHKP